MRKSKFDQSPLPVQDSKYMNQDDNISEIENRVEFDTEFCQSYKSDRGHQSRYSRIGTDKSLCRFFNGSP